MRLIQRTEGNSTPTGKYQEHGTPVWSLLGEQSRAWIKVARIIARREHPDAENDG